MKFLKLGSFTSASLIVFVAIALLVIGAYRASAQSPILPAEISRGPAYDESLRRSEDVLQSRQDNFFDGGMGADEDFEQSVPLNTRAQPEQSGFVRPVEQKPFLPQGFRAGTWQIFTRLEQAVGFATNSSFAAGGRSGGFSQTDLTATLQSDWSRHQARIDVFGSLRRSFDSQDDMIPDAAVTGSLRVDLTDGFIAAFDAGYHYATEETSSRELNADVSDRPGIHRTNAGVQLARNGGKFDIALRGTLNRVVYDDANLTNGGKQAQDDRNNTLYETSMRITYGASPALKPFVQAGSGWRVFDDEVDRNGDRRSSRILDLRAGVEFDAGNKFSGEMGVGYLREDYQGPALPRIDTVTLNGNLVWSPERGTDVTFGVSTSLGGSTMSGNPSTINRDFSLLAERQVRDNLLVNAFASAEIDQFPGGGGNDVTWTVGTGVEYFFSRLLSATANLEYQRLDSALASQSWQGASIRLGIAFQR